jgi:hypothetical protein
MRQFDIASKASFTPGGGQRREPPRGASSDAHAVGATRDQSCASVARLPYRAVCERTFRSKLVLMLRV